MPEFVPYVLVPGRGHQVGLDGELGLTPSALARVETAAEYYRKYSEKFADHIGILAGRLTGIRPGKAYGATA